MATKQMFWSQLLPCACGFYVPVLKLCSTWKIICHYFSMPNLCRHTRLRHWCIYAVNAHRFACLEKKWIQASARWHYCVVYLSNQCPFPILHLFLSHGSSLSSSPLSFYHPPLHPLFLTPPFFYAQHVLYDRASCTAGSWTQNHTVRIDMRCLKKPRKTKDRVCLSHIIDCTHIRYLYM